MKVTSYEDIRKNHSFTPAPAYSINVSWYSLERTLATWEEDYTLELEPDFQRAHVWGDEQRTRYVEYILKGGKSSREIQWNCPNWAYKSKEAPGSMTIQLVDGLQRLTAVRKFLAGEIQAFGSYSGEYTDSLRLSNADFVFSVNALQTRAEVLTWYLDLNDGGVVHSSDELDRVRELLERAK